MDLLREFYIQKATDDLVDAINQDYPQLFELMDSPAKFAQKQQTKVARGMRKSGELNPDILSPGQRAALGMPQKSQENEENAAPQQQNSGQIDPRLIRAYQWILKLANQDQMNKSHVIQILQTELQKKGGA